MSLRRVLLRGDGPALRAALDVCLIRFEVVGVREDETEIELAVEVDEAPAFERTIEDLLDGVSLDFPPSDVTNWTGLEEDAAFSVSRRILVRPPWVPRPTDFPDDGVELVVPRGGAFGSGEHGSTQAALLALDAAWPSGPSAASATFCDVGTGSGILALYASVRGAAEIAGCDVEAPAVAAALTLVPTGRFELGGPEVLLARGVRSDVVVANLTANEHDACLDSVVALWTGRGPLVLSGMRVGAERARIEQRVADLLHEVFAVGSGPSPAEGHERSGFVASTFGPYTS